MNRRLAIRQAMIFSAGIAVLPSCLQNDRSVIALKNLSLTGGEEALLSQLADTILPKTIIPGAVDLKAHEFTLMMVDDCYAPEVQKIFTAGMKQFDKLSADKYGKPFAKCTPAQKKEWLATMENKAAIPADALRFYEITRKHTLQAFTSSKEYMTDVLKYKLVPGSNFKGCVPVKNAG